VSRTGRGLALALAVLVATGTGVAVAQVSTSLVLNPTSGPPGSVVGASGVFGGHCGVRLYWDAVGGVVLGEAAVGPDGNYATSVVIPSGASVGTHLVVAAGLAEGRDFLCSRETGTLARQTFEVTGPPSGGPPVRLTLSKPEVKPGEGVVLDAGASALDVAAFDFDLDGNGTYETSCPGSRAAVVHNQRGSRTVGVQVLTNDGQVFTDSAILNVAGTAAPPPPKPGGGRTKPYQEGTIVGTCVDEAQVDLDAIVKAWYCPEAIWVGVVEARFRKAGINPAAKDACFERHEETLFGGKVVFFVASKNKSNATGNPVRVNGLEFDHPAENTWPKAFYKNELMFVETIPLLGAFGPYGPSEIKKSDFRITLWGSGHTSVASEPFSLVDPWDISKPGVAGWVTMGKQTYIANNEFLGLGVAKKLTQVKFATGYSSRLTLHLSLPFTNFSLASASTTAVDAVAWNEGNQTVVIPASASISQWRRRPAAPTGPISFKGIKLGIFTMNATLTYEKQGASDVWSGSMELVFPGNVKVGGTLVIRDGEFESAHVQEEPGPPGWGPVGCCVWIYKIFGDLTPLYVGAGARFGIGPEIPILQAPPAEVTGDAKIFYGDPWSFVLTASNLKLAGISVNANAQVVISSSGFLALAFVDEDWGPLELQANVEAKVSSSTWYATGGGTVCVDLEVLEGCGGGKVGIGKKGIAGCAVIPYLPDGGVALRWKFFTGDLLAWDMWWGCSYGDIKGQVGANALARSRSLAADGLARQTVTVAPGLPKILFAIEGAGAAPKVTLTAPDGSVVASDPGAAVASGPGWTLVEVPHDDTTYVTVNRPASGAWDVEEQPGSSIISIGTAGGHPRQIVDATIGGRGQRRTIDYEIADVDGIRVTFVERGGDPEGEPGSFVEQVIGSARGGSGELRFTPAEGSVRSRTIVAEISVDGIPIETERIGSYTAPPLTPLPAPKLDVQRSGRGLVIEWTGVRGASFYRVVVDRSDGPTEVFDVTGRRLRVGGLTARTTTRIMLQAVSAAGYFGATVRAVA
jgi:hypothetical protein